MERNYAKSPRIAMDSSCEVVTSSSLPAMPREQSESNGASASRAGAPDSGPARSQSHRRSSRRGLWRRNRDHFTDLGSIEQHLDHEVHPKHDDEHAADRAVGIGLA